MFAGSSQQAGLASSMSTNGMIDKENMDPLQQRQPGPSHAGVAGPATSLLSKQQPPGGKTSSKNGRTPLADITSSFFIQVTQAQLWTTCWRRVRRSTTADCHACWLFTACCRAPWLHKLSTPINRQLLFQNSSRYFKACVVRSGSAVWPCCVQFQRLCCRHMCACAVS